MERALEGGDAAGDGAVHVAEGAGDDAGGEGAGVEVVLGVEDERDVHDPLVLAGRLLSRHEVEQVRGVREPGIAAGVGVHEGPAVDDGLHVADDGGDFGEEALGLAEVGGGVVLLRVRVEVAEKGDGGAEHVHRDGGAAGEHGVRASDVVEDGAGERALEGDLAFESRELVGRGLVAFEQEERDVFEGGVLGEVVDLVSAVDELALLD
jgi:hypothetical protein